MNFGNKEKERVVPLLLEPRSLVILRSDARYNWTHRIAARKTDDFQGRVIERRRVSLTFRKVILDGAPG
jgi:alkylated DNA repair dioxygenase AlkB